MPSNQRHRGRGGRAHLLAAARASVRGPVRPQRALAKSEHSSESPPHGFCKPMCGWMGGMIARAVE
eukprot:9384281-Pyramimonas_sp.AAC.1